MYKDGVFFRKIERNCYDPEARIEDADRDDLSVSVLSPVPVLFQYHMKSEEDAAEWTKYVNDFIAMTCAENPKRFVGLGILPLQHPQAAIKELRRCVTELGLAGVEIGTHVNDWELSSPDLFPVWEAAAELGAAIFVHPWNQQGAGPACAEDPAAAVKWPYWMAWLVSMPSETARAICSLIMGGVFERLPNLRVAFAHGGGSFPSLIGRIEHGFNTRPDLCAVENKVNPKEYLGKFWLDSLVHDDTMLAYLVDLVGQSKVCLGTDYPFVLGEHVPGKRILEHPELSDEAKADLLANNALTWLGLEKEQFL